MGFSALTGSAIHACTAAPQGPRAERPDCSRTAGVQRHADAIAHRDQQIAPSADYALFDRSGHVLAGVVMCVRTDSAPDWSDVGRISFGRVSPAPPCD